MTACRHAVIQQCFDLVYKYTLCRGDAQTAYSFKNKIQNQNSKSVVKCCRFDTVSTVVLGCWHGIPRYTRRRNEKWSQEREKWSHKGVGCRLTWGRHEPTIVITRAFKLVGWGVPAFSSLISSMLQMFPRKKNPPLSRTRHFAPLSGIEGAHSLARARYIRTHLHFPNGGGREKGLFGGKKGVSLLRLFLSWASVMCCQLERWEWLWRGGFGYRIRSGNSV